MTIHCLGVVLIDSLKFRQEIKIIQFQPIIHYLIEFDLFSC